MKFKTTLYVTSLATMGFAALVGCSAGMESNSAEQGTGVSSEAIRNGTVVTPWAAGSTAPTYAKSVVYVSSGCTGTVVQPSWVVTARHCGTTVGAQVTSRRPSGNINRNVDAVVSNPDAAGEATMLHLSTPFTDVPLAPLSPLRTDQIVGKTVRTYGYGAKQYGASCSATDQSRCTTTEHCMTHWGLCMTDSAELRTADFTAGTSSDSSNALFALTQNGANQALLPGDSGGPAFLDGSIAGVDWYGNTTTSQESAIGLNREFIASASRQKFTVGDFNGDGKKDVIVTNASGSHWYYSTGSGTWSLGYDRPDLPLGSVKYTTGDFNGDGKTDLIVTNSSGSYWYYSTGTGTWNGAYTRDDLVFGQVDFYTGDFNGDGREDVIIQAPQGATAQGSAWYFSTGTPGSWYVGYTRPDLVTGIAKYVVADFNGDGKKDFIVSTPTGSYWYYSTGLGTWNVAYTRTDLPTQVAEFVAGDFNGDHLSDVIILTSNGSYWYYSTGTGTWNNAYTRGDMPLGTVNYTVADFNGDARSDMLISNASGSYWYQSTGTGTWENPYSRGDLAWHDNNFTPGDFNGDGKSDVIISNVTGSYWYYSTGGSTWLDLYDRTDFPK